MRLWMNQPMQLKTNNSAQVPYACSQQMTKCYELDFRDDGMDGVQGANIGQAFSHNFGCSISFVWFICLKNQSIHRIIYDFNFCSRREASLCTSLNQCVLLTACVYMLCS